MADTNLQFKIENKVATITWGGPPEDSAQLYELASHLSLLCDQIGEAHKAHVVILSGDSEKAWDFGGLLLETTPDLPQISDAIGGFNGPIIAAIRGDVIGQGLELALACDLRIAGKGSTFGLPHIKMDQIPWDGGTQRLARTIGTTKAMEMILTGEPIDAVEALRLDLINQAVPGVDVLKTAQKMARLIAEKGPISLEYTKEAIHKGLDLTLKQGLRLEADLYYLLHTTRDRTEGIKAFREKRKPAFKGE